MLSFFFAKPKFQELWLDGIAKLTCFILRYLKNKEKQVRKNQNTFDLKAKLLILVLSAMEKICRNPNFAGQRATHGRRSVSIPITRESRIHGDDGSE